MAKKKNGKSNSLMTIRMDNEIIDLPFGNLTAKQNDVLHVLTYYSQDKGDGVRSISIPLFREIMGLSPKDGRDVLDEFVTGMYDAVSETTFVLRGTNKTIVTKYFDSAVVDYENNCIDWEPNKHLVPLINNLTGNYTKLQLQGFLSLSNSYAKNIYRKLSRFRSTGIWRISIADLRVYLAIPDSYTTADIDRRILNPSIKALSPYFHNLTVNKIYAHHEGKGRPAVYGYVFTFTIDDDDDSNLEEYLALKNGYEKSVFVCPVCGKNLYWKYFDFGKEGTMRKLCHPDFNEGCNRVFTVEELSLIASHDQEEQGEEDKN